MMPACPKQHADFVLSLVIMRMIDCQGVEPEASAAPVHLEERLDGDHHEVVAGLPEDRPLRFRNADYIEGAAIEMNYFANRVYVGKESFLQVIPDEGHSRPFPVLDIGQKAARCGLGVRDDTHICGDASQANIFYAVIAVMHGNAPRSLHPDCSQERSMGIEEFIFINGQFRISPAHFQIFLRVPFADHGQAPDPESVGAHVGDLIGDVAVHSFDDRHDSDQSCRGEDDAQ
jgi:hypothetical protein